VWGRGEKDREQREREEEMGERTEDKKILISCCLWRNAAE
jgi:hypothetical protein